MPNGAWVSTRGNGSPTDLVGWKAGGMFEIAKQRFDALAGYIRAPEMVLLVQEAAWFATAGERLLGLVVWDRTDYDYGWVVLGRDRRARFRAIAQDASLPDFATARGALDAAMARLHSQADD